MISVLLVHLHQLPSLINNLLRDAVLHLPILHLERVAVRTDVLANFLNKANESVMVNAAVVKTKLSLEITTW